MSVKVTTKTVYRWRCQAPGCPRQGRRWTARKEKRPQVCPTCHSHRWDGVDRRNKNAVAAQKPEKILLTFYRCTCELPGCPGKGKPWDTRVEPKHGSHCKWCHRTSWNGVDRRRKEWRQPSLPAPDPSALIVDRRRKDWRQPSLPAPDPSALIAEQNSGQGTVDNGQAGAKSPGQQTDAIATTGGRVTIARPAGTGHALGCKCTVCQMAKGAIKLPRPDKVRSIE